MSDRCPLGYLFLYADSGTLDMKHIRQDFIFGGVAEAHIKLCAKYSHVAYQIKGMDAYSYMVANTLPTDTPLTPGMGSKGQTIFFSESRPVAYLKWELSVEHHES